MTINNIKENHHNFSILLTTGDEDDRTVFIAGNFNNRQTQDRNYAMEKLSPGNYFYQFPNDFQFPGELLYKFTKGDWSEVEIDQYGNRTDNRSCVFFEGQKKEHVHRWRSNWLTFLRIISL